MIYFYLVDPETDPRLKIGHSDDFAKRDKQHRASKLGVKVELQHLCLIRADQSDEDKIHRTFRSVRYGDEDEIFHPADELVEWVRWLRDQYYVWIPDDAYRIPWEELPIIEPDFWMPTADRRKKAFEEDSIFSGCNRLVFPSRVITVDDYYTNEIIIRAAKNALGEIDLDPASHVIANRNVQAKRIYTANENGLLQEWSGRVWLNPPFSQWSEWVPKVVSEFRSGRIEAMCALSACRTLTAQYFTPIRELASAVCILNGRIPFWGGKATSSPDDGHVVFYFGKELDRFYRAFVDLGTVHVLYEHGRAA